MKNRQQSCTFLKNLKHYLHTIPDDCREGLKELDMLISKKWDWNQDILPAWGLAAWGEVQTAKRISGDEGNNPGWAFDQPYCEKMP